MHQSLQWPTHQVTFFNKNCSAVQVPFSVEWLLVGEGLLDKKRPRHVEVWGVTRWWIWEHNIKDNIEYYVLIYQERYFLFHLKFWYPNFPSLFFSFFKAALSNFSNDIKVGVFCFLHVIGNNHQTIMWQPCAITVVVRGQSRTSRHKEPALNSKPLFSFYGPSYDSEIGNEKGRGST